MLDYLIDLFHIH